MAAFPEDFEINVDIIVRLSVAEGFLKVGGSECLELEDVAEGYLDDVIRRNLLLVGKRRSDGRLRTIGMHDLWRDICTFKAQEKRFLFHAQSSVNSPMKEHRVTIHSSISEVSKKRFVCDFTTRSMIFFRLQMSLDPLLNYRFLQVLDALEVYRSYIRLEELVELVHLRYLAFWNKWIDYFDGSLSKLRNLQTLMIYHAGERYTDYERFIPLASEILKMPQPRHLILSKRSYFADIPGPGSVVGETNLQTHSLVTNLQLTEEVIKMFVNVRKLGLYYCHNNMAPPHDWIWGDYYLNNLVLLPKLEILKIISSGGGNRRWLIPMSENFAFPSTLKKLTLEGYRIPWEHMTNIGSLPNLEVLKLKRGAFQGTSWHPNEEEFLRLKHLEYCGGDGLSNWEVENVHFPRLRRLILKFIGHDLKEIPPGIGDIATLELIELHHCQPSIVDSAKQIQEEQRDMGNDALQVRVYK